MYLNSFYHFLNFQRGNESKSLLLKPYAYSITKKKKKIYKTQNTSRMLPVNKTEAENVQVLNS